MPRAHPPIVTAAGRGDLATVTQLLAAGVPVDSSDQWVETEEKHGYNKSWTWHSDTALCAAVRGGHTDVAVALLAAGADPEFGVCNVCDKHETPRGIAKEVLAKHPECAQALLGPAFEEQRAKAEAALALASPSLFERAACELRIAHALELAAKSLERSDEALPYASLWDVGRVFEASESTLLACVPEGLRTLVKDAWKHATLRKHSLPSRECITLGHLYLRGEGVAADEAAAVLWLSRGLAARPVEDVAYCWQWHAEFSQGGLQCNQCKLFREARATLTMLTGSAAVGAAATAALAADEQHSAALLDTSLHRLEVLRRQAATTQRALEDEERKRKNTERAEKQRLQDERFKREVRDPEVARCAQFAAQRNASYGGRICHSRHCDNQDYCTYWHEGKSDLPPRCQWFFSGKCRNGPRCWFNHLPDKPPRVPLE